MFNFMQQTTADKIEDAVFAAYYAQIKDGNTEILRRPLPVVGIAEEMDVLVDEVTGDESEVSSITYLDTSDVNDYEPKTVVFNKEFIDKLDQDAIEKVVLDSLMLEAPYVDETVLDTYSGIERTTVDKDGDAVSYATQYQEGDAGLDEEAAGTEGGGVCSTIDMSTLGKLASAEEDKEAEAMTVTVDKYDLKDLKKTPTIVSSDNSRYYYKGAATSDNELEHLLEEVAEIQEILEGAIDAAGLQKSSSETPDKRLNVRNVVIGHDKEYYHKHMVKGKKLNLGVVLDRSGSMNGKPAQDSAVLITAINNLCHMYNELRCTVVFSDDSEYHKMVFPTSSVNSIELLNFTNTHGAEGLAENMDKELEVLEDADVTFVYTDGDICSGNVDKPKYTALGIHLVGLYTATPDDGDKISLESYERHYNKNKAWFHDVVISSTATDLAEHMADYMSAAH